MSHQWFNRNFTKLREYFLCAKKTKITTLFNNSSSPRHPGAILDSITYVNNVCMQIRCLRSEQSVNNVSAYIRCMCCLHMWYSPKWCQGDAEETNYWEGLSYMWKGWLIVGGGYYYCMSPPMSKANLRPWLSANNNSIYTKCK